MKLPAIDKQAHFWWGWAIAATLYPISLWFAIIVTAIIGASKEMRDSLGYGTPDVWDFVATALGGAVGALCCALLGLLSG